MSQQREAGDIIHTMLKRMCDPRPAAAIGHVFLKVSDVPAAVQFLTSLGLRLIDEGDDFAVLELHGGGLKPSRIQRLHFHRSFTVIGPDRYVLTITSSHTGNRVV